jgi:ATP-binding cassette subfamily B protein
MAIPALRLAYLRRTLAIVWDASGWRLVVWAALLGLQGAIPVVTVWLTKPLVDGLQAAVGGGVSWEALRSLAGVAIAMAALVLGGRILTVARQWLGWTQAELVEERIADLVHAQATRMDLAFYETPEFLDRLYRVRSDSATRPLALLEGAGNVLQNAITVIGIGALLLGYGWWVGAILLLGTLPAFLVVMRANREQHAFWLSRTTDRRRAQYLSELLTGAPSAAEVRLFSLGEHFRARYRTLRRALRIDRLRMLRRHAIERLLAEGVAAASAGATIGWMLWRAFRGLATLGDVALFFQAFRRAQGLVQGLFGSVNQLHSNALFLENLFEFLAMEPGVVAPPVPAPVPARLAQGVRFRGVTFRYPGTDRLALDRFDLTIPAGRTVAIVGANGAGKSTVIKVLARFYDPHEGSVEVDGVDLRRLDPDALHGLMTVMVQQPVAFQDTARANIALSDLRGTPSPARVEAAARDAGAAALIARLPQGYDSILGKQFPGGTELSGGEWQRIAMARALYRRTPLVILDEPTSQLDSWAESDWYERFHRLVEGATALVVTHRLSIARQADVIHVMEAARARGPLRRVVGGSGRTGRPPELTPHPARRHLPRDGFRDLPRRLQGLRWRRDRGPRPRSRGARRRVPRPRGPLRFRQEHGPPHDRRARPPDHRQDPDRRA